MLGLNNIQIIGNLGGAPQVTFSKDSSSQIVNFSVAVNERWRNRDGDPQERLTWLRVVAFNGIGQVCAEHLVKGDAVYIEGRLQVREYEDKNGAERTSVEVVASKVRFLGRGVSNASAPGQPSTRGTSPTDSADNLAQAPFRDDPF